MERIGELIPSPLPLPLKKKEENKIPNQEKKRKNFRQGMNEMMNVYVAGTEGGGRGRVGKKKEIELWMNRMKSWGGREDRGWLVDRQRRRGRSVEF